jgi:hypothetical protein
MIIGFDKSQAVSFNDDTSPDTRATARQRVSINAQVIRERSLHWFEHLRGCCPDVSGEIKSVLAWNALQALPAEGRSNVWSGLSKVRIHVVDPRPYVDKTNALIRRVMDRRDAPEILRQRRFEGDPWATWLTDELTKFTARSILQDSTAARVHLLGQSLKPAFFIGSRFTKDTAKSDVVDVEDFGRDTKPMIRTATAWAAKSAAAFQDAIDCWDDLEEKMAVLRFFPQAMIRKRMESRVLDGHAFDDGNKTQIDLLETVRTRMLTGLATNQFSRYLRKPSLYERFDSRNCLPIQAADIAAGIAVKIFDTTNFVGLVSHFEYVTLNGQRLSIADAGEAQRHTEK